MKQFQSASQISLSKLTLGALLAWALMASPPSWAAKTPTKGFSYIFEEAPSRQVKGTSLTPEQNQELLAKFKSGRRVATTVEPTESDFKADYNQFLKELFAIKVVNPVKDRGADQLEKLISDYSKAEKYATLSPETQLVVAQLATLGPFRGIIYRLRHLFEEESRNVHSLVVTQIRNVASSLRVYLPNDEWSAGFDFITKPSVVDARSTQFGTVFQFQNFLVSPEVLGALDLAIQRLTALRDAVGANKIYLDNRIAFGPEAFGDKLDQYKVIDAAELNLLISGYHSAKANIYVFSAYDQDDALAAGETLGKITGLNSMMPFTQLGVTSQDRVKKVFGKYPNYLKLWDSAHLKTQHRDYVKRFPRFETESLGETLMSLSFASLEESIKLAEAGVKLVRSRDPNRFEVIKTLEARANEREVDAVFSNIHAMLDGQPVTSTVTRRAVTANIKLFFSNPPKDLKVFLPTQWDDTNGASDDLKVTTVNSRELKYRNYFKGRATGWNNAAWSKYMSSTTSVDVPELVRSLRLTWGGGFAGNAAGLFVR